MRRRHFVAGACAVAVDPFRALAQVARKPARIGFLGLGSMPIVQSRIASLRRGFAVLGYQDGRDYVVEARAAGTDPDELKKAAADIAGLGFDVLVTHAAGTAALMQATKTIPIVMVSGDAVATGLVATLSRPGGNVTGMSYFSPELMAKRLELLKDALPALEHAGVLAVADQPVSAAAIAAVEASGRALGVRLHPVLIANPGELDRAFSALAEKRVRALVVQDEPMIIANSARIAELAVRHRVVSIGSLEAAVQGGAMGYSVEFGDLYRRAASFVVRILQGARPGELPVEQPTNFRLVVNVKALSALDVAVSPSLLVRADEVIE